MTDVYDLACSFVGSITVITVSSLMFARWVLRREDQLDDGGKRLSLAERRKLLAGLRNKTKDTWLRNSGTISDRAYKRLEKLEEDIAKLDDEEVRIAGGG